MYILRQKYYFFFQILLFAQFALCDDVQEENLNQELFEAVKVNNYPLVNQLLHQGANPDAKNIDNKSLLSFAKDEKIKKLLELSSFSKKQKLNQELFEAVKAHDLELMKKLIHAGADVNAVDDSFNSPLHFASGSKEIDLLFKSGAFMNQRNTNLETPLHTARNVHDAELLMNRGADVNSKDYRGQTMLHKTNNLELLNTLLNHQADVNAVDNFGMTPLHYSQTPEKSHILLKAGANPRIKDFAGDTPLHLVSDKVSAELLLKNGADVNAKNNEGFTPLHMVKDPEIAKLLLKYGADRSITDNFGLSAYKLAGSKKLKEVIDPMQYEKDNNNNNKVKNKEFLKPSKPSGQPSNNFVRQRYQDPFDQRSDSRNSYSIENDSSVDSFGSDGSFIHA